MPSSFFSPDSRSANSGTTPEPLATAAPWQVYGQQQQQQQQQPNQGPAGSAPPATDHVLLDSDCAVDAALDAADGDDTLDLSLPQDSSSSDNDDPPAAAPSSADPSSADPLRAERRRSNQLEKELRKERLMERLFSEAEGRVGGHCPSMARASPSTPMGWPSRMATTWRRCAATRCTASCSSSAAPNLQTLSTAELYLEAVKGTTPRGGLHRGADERIAYPLLRKLMAWYLVFWRNRSTSTVVPAASASQARVRAQRKQMKGYGAIVAARRANTEDSRLIRRGVWVRRRRDGSSPQFGPAQSKARARRQRSSYRHWL